MELDAPLPHAPQAEGEGVLVEEMDEEANPNPNPNPNQRETLRESPKGTP